MIIKRENRTFLKLPPCVSLLRCHLKRIKGVFSMRSFTTNIKISISDENIKSFSKLVVCIMQDY